MATRKSSKEVALQQYFFFRDGPAEGPWSEEEILWLKENYPRLGKAISAERLGRSEASIRAKTHRLGIKQDRNSWFFSDWQSRAAASKVGKKRPDQSTFMRQMHRDGKFVITEKTRQLMSKRAKEQIRKHGHPRGYAGRKHSAKTKALISVKSREQWARMTEEEKRDLIMRSMKSAEAMGRNNMSRRQTTWKADWREIGGRRSYFRSRWEANYARYLQWLKSNGSIREWEHEPKTFWFDQVKRGCVSYLPDFRVTENSGEEIYHEVKGWMDDRSKTKIKRMAKYFPEVKLIVIDASAYRKLASQVAVIVPEWE